MRTKRPVLPRHMLIRICALLGVLGVLGGLWLAQSPESPAESPPSQIASIDLVPIAGAAKPRRALDQDALASPKWGPGRGIVCGVVRDAASGEAIEGATISLSLSRVAGSGMPTPGTKYPSVVTGSDGTWLLKGGMPGAKVNVTAGAEGYEPSRNGVMAARECAKRIPLMMNAGGAVLSGVVYDGLGGTISGGLIEVKRIAVDDVPAFARAPIVARSDEDGHYQVSVRSGSQIVTVRSEGYAKSTNQVLVNTEGATYDVHLLPAGRIEGVVVDAKSKQPVAGALVSLEEAGTGILVGTGGDAVSDPDGRFVIEGVAPGLHDVRGSEGSRATSEEVRVALSLGEVVEDVTLEISPQLYVRGRVIDEQQRPVARVMVQAIAATNMVVGEPTDSEGRYFLGPIKSGDYMISATRMSSMVPDLVASSVTLGTDPLEDHDIVVTTRATVRGRVEGGGASTVVRVEVAGSGSSAAVARQLGNSFLSAHCDEDGNFELRDVIPGEVIIAADDSSLGKAQVGVRVPPSGLDDVQLALSMRAGVHVRVVDVEGHSVAGVALLLSQEGARPRLRAGSMFMGDTLRTDEDGRASSGTLSPGRFSLSATQAGTALKIESEQAVTLTEGWQDVEVVVLADRGGLEIRTVDENGAPKEGVVVSVQTGASALTSLTGDDGAALFDAVGVMGTKLLVSLTDPLGGANVKKLATVGVRLEVVIPVGQRLLVDVTGFGRGYVEVDGVAGKRRRDYDGQRERAMFAGLVRGQYSVRVVGTEGYGNSVVTLPDQESVRPEKLRWAQVQGRVLSADGTPASGLPVIVKGTEGFSPDTDITSVASMAGIVTDKDGRFQVKRCFSGSNVLSFAGDGVYYKGSPITLEEGEQRVLPDFLIPKPT